MRLGEGVLEEDNVMAFAKVELGNFVLTFNCKLTIVIHVSINIFRCMATLLVLIIHVVDH